MRYINRLTPVTIIGKATEKGLEELGKTVLSPHFVLSDAEDKLEDGATAPSVSKSPIWTENLRWISNSYAATIFFGVYCIVLCFYSTP